MQLNIYVPNEKTEVVTALDEAARRQGRPENEIVLEAVKAYLGRVCPDLGVFRLGPVDLPCRGYVHLERWER